MELIAQIIIKDKHKGNTVAIVKEAKLHKDTELENEDLWRLDIVVPVKNV